MTNTRVALRLIMFILILLGACSCANMITATGYGPDNLLFKYGYSESRRGDRAYHVNYTYNDRTSLAVCEGYLYRRCAELTRDAGYDYFVMDSHVSQLVQREVKTAGRTEPVGSGKSHAYVYIPGDHIKSMEPFCYGNITMYRGTKPESQRDAFTPDEILRNLEK